MKKFLPALMLLICSITATAQTYNNEWIDYSKTYYKFKVGATGLYRIPQTTLAAAGLSATAAEHFKLWRHGEEVALYTSVGSGPLTASDYLEFYGEMNDGKEDKKLYRYDSLQMSDKYSLMSDTASYFLTVNSSTANLRISGISNPVAGNVLPAEPYFMHKLAQYSKQKINPGFGIDFGELVNSSSYETGEGWTSDDIYGGISFYRYLPNLHVYSAGPAASINAVTAGNSANGRNVIVKINNTTFSNAYVSAFSIQRSINNAVPLSVFPDGDALVEIYNDGFADDRIVFSNFVLTYPRQFDFGFESQFYFELPSSGTGNFLNITDFNYGATAPVLYDLTNNLRLVADISSGNPKFVLPPSVTARKMVLLNAAAGTGINNISALTQRNFINYSTPGNQGNYIIISHPNLYNDGSGNNQVENYRLYRSSAEGGNYNAKIIDIDQVVDQFGFGIRNNPLSIRNFTSYVLATYTAVPKYLFLVGRGLDYTEYLPNQADPTSDKLGLIPTFGWPASDNLLTATRTGYTARIPMGRLSAVSGLEVKNYLDKVKEFELAQASTVQTVANKGWMKNVAQITGAIADQGLYNLLSNYMQGYEAIITDTLFGGKVYSFSQNSGQYNAIGSNKTIDSLFDNGMTLLTYFGHSSPNTLEFNLDNPNSYNNPGKYPLILINGCATGNFFTFDNLRPTPGNGTLSEKYLFANRKGSVGFIANTHLGLPQQIDYFTSQFYRNITSSLYGSGIGDLMKNSMEFLSVNYANDFVARCHSEEITYHGDPALKLNPQAKPDYIIEDSLISFDPPIVSVADEKITIHAKILNIGRAVNDSLTVRFQQQLPDNSITTIAVRKIKATLFEDTLDVSVQLNPLLHRGNNNIIVTIDPSNLIPELSETNNTVTKSFTVLEDEIRPVYPYNYAIVNSPPVALYGSTANPTSAVKQYVLEIDTTRLFNSAFKITVSVVDSGGIIKFAPGLVYTDSTVYYWRLAVGPVTGSTHWLGSSFVYMSGVTEGYSQSHFYQYSDNKFLGLKLDTASRKFQFDDKTRKLLVRAGIYPYYSWDQNNININSDQLEFWGCVFNNLQFYVLDSLTHQPWSNVAVSGSGKFGSYPPCINLGNPVRKFFEFPFGNATYRKKAMDFFDSIPSGMYVTIRALIENSNSTFIDQWKADTATLGSGNSLWHKFHQMGLHQIDSFTTNRQFVFVFKKSGSTASEIRQFVAPQIDIQLVDTALLIGKDVAGSITSPLMGPVKSWSRFKWNKRSLDDSTNSRYFQVIGQNSSGNDVVLATIYNSTDTSISFINAAVYPYLKLKIFNNDVLHAKPTQLSYWMLTGTKMPEGGLSPNRYFQFADTLFADDTLRFKVSFKNISNVPFDSLKVKLTVTDKNGNSFSYSPAGSVNSKLAPLPASDSIILSYNIPAATYGGKNQLLLDVNPNKDQPEQFHFNNVLYRNFWVLGPVCPGSDVYYTSGYRGGGYTYRWQADTGGGFADLSDDAVYSGSGSDSMRLIAPPTSWYGNKYRCVITAGATTYYSQEYSLKFGMRWLGTVNNAWENAANWSCGSLPDEHTDVTVAAGAINYPQVNATVSCRSLAVGAGVTVTIATGANLTIKK